MLGVARRSRLFSHERCSERSYLFTMSDITRPHAAFRRHDGCGICFRRTSQGSRAPRENGGARRDRTDDLLLAKQALSQLSYGPGERTSHAQHDTERESMVGLGRLELPTSRLSSARSNQLSYKPLILTNGRILRRGIRCRRADIRHGLVREERETETAVSRKTGSD